MTDPRTPSGRTAPPETRPSAVFLDRDGVLIENVPTYVREWREVRVFPQAVEACRRLTDLGIPLVVVTNQAGVARGVYTRAYAEDLNRRILAEFERAGVRFAAAHLCPHGPEDACDCRKPLPGMIHRAARDLGIDLARARLVGDSVTDLLAAAAAGVAGILVRTGRGIGQETEMRASGLDRPVFDDLLRATEAILAGV